MDYKKLVKEKEEEFNELFTRMDSDKDLFFLKPFVLKGYDGNEVKGVDNVTLSDPHFFASRVISVIGSAEPQITVKGRNMEDKDTSRIENFIRGAFYSANKRNSKKLIMPVHQFNTTTSVLQGWCGNRVVVYQKGNDVIFDILPLDMRRVTYDVGGDGLIWAAYKTKRSKAAIEAEYEHEIKGKEAEVIDFWHKEDKVNVIIIDGKEIKTNSNDIGVPFIIQPVALTPLMGEDGIEHFGESVYSANRDLYDEANKQMTILQTLSSLYFRPPMAVLTEDGTWLPDAYPYVAAAMVAMKKGEGFMELPIGDVSKTAPFAYSILNKNIQLGGLPYSEYGTLDFPLSAIAIEKLEGHRDQVFLPRLQALGQLYRGTSRMIIEQFIAGGQSAEIGEEGEEIEYKPKELEGKFQITFNMSTTSPEKSIARYEIAAMAKNVGISDREILEKVMEVDDPTRSMELMLSQQTGDMVPAVKLYRAALLAIRLAGELKGEEAAAMNAEAELIMGFLKQMFGQGMQPPQGQAGQQPQRPAAPPTTPEEEAGVIEEEAMGREGAVGREGTRPMGAGPTGEV